MKEREKEQEKLSLKKKEAPAMVVLLTQASKSAGWEGERKQGLVRQ